MDFVTGGASGMIATCIIQPVDLVKTRMQLQGMGGVQHKSAVHAFVNVVRQEGFFGLYTGLSAALLRQATYTTTRLGVFSQIQNKLKEHNNGGAIPMYQKMVAGLTAGAAGAIVGTPAEVALVRMTADGRLPAELRRNYKNVGDALFRVVREEGVMTLWRGCGPTVARAMLLNMAQLSTYSQAKQMLLASGYFKDNTGCHMAASLTSGFMATFVSLPSDIIKTRMQNMATVNGVPEFKGSVDCVKQLVKKEGVLALWKSFPTFFVRIGGHTILTFLALEQINSLVKKYNR
eukprot:Colp12_sorted_trinity150504_noHs@4954